MLLTAKITLQIYHPFSHGHAYDDVVMWRAADLKDCTKAYCLDDTH